MHTSVKRSNTAASARFWVPLGFLPCSAPHQPHTPRASKPGLGGEPSLEAVPGERRAQRRWGRLSRASEAMLQRPSGSQLLSAVPAWLTGTALPWHALGGGAQPPHGSVCVISKASFVFLPIWREPRQAAGYSGQRASAHCNPASHRGLVWESTSGELLSVLSSSSTTNSTSGAIRAMLIGH